MKAPLGVAVAAIVFALAACGIPADRDPRAVQPPPGPYQALASPPPPESSQTGPIVETLYLIKDGTIMAVDRRVSAEPTVETIMADLLAGPTDAERAQGLGSALPGAVDVAGVAVDNGLAVVTLGAALEGTGRSDEVLAFGQIVCTLDGRPDVHGVTFIYQGLRVGVPREDGSLTTSPLTTADYEPLFGHR